MIHIYIYDKTHIDSVSASEIICNLAASYTAEYKLEGVFDTILYGDKGKPYFKNSPDLHFSISHSGDYWVCALSCERIGIDLQEIRDSSYLPLAKRFFHPDEYAYLSSFGTALEEEFFNIWASKESYVKYTGTGISENFSTFSVLEPAKLFVSFNLIPFKPGYKLCLCSKNALPFELCYQVGLQA